MEQLPNEPLPPPDVYRPDPVTPLENQTPQEAYTKKKVIFRTYQIIWYILGVIEVLLLFRIVLKLLGANPLSGFAAFIYLITAPLAFPFSGILPVSRSGNTIMEWSTIIAMIVYLLVAYGLVKLFQIVKPTDPEEVIRTVDTQ